MIEEIPTPIALLFAGYILGVGYLALLSFFDEKEYKEIRDFDKFMLSLTFGVFSFMVVIGLLNINLNLNDDNSLISFMRASPIVFIINVIVARYLMKMWKLFSEKILN